ncbi:MAG: FtsL-like putative cell division protein [Bacteroidota bacterium]|nr:FtsL-like putative cell division protein [Bacteroidota bacterium]
MNLFKKISEAIRGSEDFSDIKSSTIRDILNGNILTKKFFQKQYGLLIMIAVLTFLYVDNRFYCETQLAHEIDLKKKILDVKYESLTISAELMEISRESNVLKKVNESGLNLIQSSAQPIVIEDSIPQK